MAEDEKDSKTDREMKSTLFLVNIVLTTKVKKLQEEIGDLKERIQKYETKGVGNINFGSDLGKKKRKRKTKDQVERNFRCNIGTCNKSYGSENSLNQHMKLKHPEFWAKIKEKEQILTFTKDQDKKKREGESSVKSEAGVKQEDGLEVKEEEEPEAIFLGDQASLLTPIEETREVKKEADGDSKK